GAGRALGPHDPDADALVAPLAADVEGGKRVDDEVLERGDEGAHVLAPPLEVEHEVGHTLAGAVIGVFAAAAGLVDGEALVLDQVLAARAGAGRVEGRVLDQPDELAGAPFA